MHNKIFKFKITMLVLFSFFILTVCFSQKTFAITVSDVVYNTVVTISANDKSGTGFIVSADGYILTNKHVVEPNKQVFVVFANNEKLTANVVALGDQTTDLALLKVEKNNLPLLRISESQNLKQGEEVYFFGSPLGLPNTMHKGTVSNTSQEIESVKYIQLNASVNSGNSGGPLVNGKGELIGVITMKADNADGIGLALPIEKAYSLLVQNKVLVSTDLDNLAFREISEKHNADLQTKPVLPQSNQFIWGMLIVFIVIILAIVGFWGIKFYKAKKKNDFKQKKEDELDSVDVQLENKNKGTSLQKRAIENDENDDLEIILHDK